MNIPPIHIHIPVDALKEDRNTMKPIHIHIPDISKMINQTVFSPLNIYIHLETKTNFFDKWAEKFREFIENEEQQIK